MALSNLPKHVKVMLAFVLGGLILLAGGLYGFAKMGRRNAQLAVELRQLEGQRGEFGKLAKQLTQRQDEYFGEIMDLKQLSLGLKKDEIIPSTLEEFRIASSYDHLALISFRPGDMITPPAIQRTEAAKTEKPFDLEVGEILVGRVVGGDSWAVFDVSKVKKESKSDYEVLGVGAIVTTPSGRQGVIKTISETGVQVEHKNTVYSAKIPRAKGDAMKLDLAFEGTYEDFQRFLQTMNRFPKMVKVTNVSIGALGPETNRLRYRVDSQLFFVPEEVEKVLEEAKASIGGAYSAGGGAGGVGGVVGNEEGASAGAGSE